MRDPIEVYRRPWALVAAENDLPPPDDEDVMRAVGARPQPRRVTRPGPGCGVASLVTHRPLATPRVRARGRHATGAGDPADVPMDGRLGHDAAADLRALREEGRRVRTHTFEPADGALEWLTMLKEYEVPCCVCAGTALDRASAESALTRAGLHHLLDEYVTLEDGCETAEQSFLVSFIKLRRA